MTRVRIRYGAAGAWLFGLAIVYLAGLSMAGVLYFIFLLYLLFPLLSFAFLILAYARFRYFEFFSTDHPQKGEEVVYRLTLSNESPLPGAYVDVEFLTTGPGASLRLERLNGSLGRRGQLQGEHRIRFPFRGVYQVGIQRLRLTDSLAWLQFFAEVWHRTFYVYPRVIPLTRVFSSLHNSVEASGEGQGIIVDHTLYTDVREYQPGVSVKHMAWKKFAATGEPHLKAYERTSWPGVELYLDLRREREPDRAVLEREDASLEILVALYNYFLDRRVPASAHAYNGRDRYDFTGTRSAAFEAFYKATIGVNFEGSVSPLRVLQSDLSDRRVKASTIIIITHVFDPEIVEAAARGAAGSGGSDLSVFGIINQTAMSDDEKLNNHLYARTLPGLGSNLIFLDRPEGIKECLEQ